MNVLPTSVGRRGRRRLLGVGLVVVVAVAAGAAIGGADLLAIARGRGSTLTQVGRADAPVTVATTTTPPATTTPTTTVAPEPIVDASGVPVARRRAEAQGAGFHYAAGLPPGPSVVARAVGRSVEVFSQPGDPSPVTRLASPLPTGVPQVLLVLSQQPDWLEVLLPLRPNGSAAWIRTDQVTLDHHDFRIVVQLAAHRLTVYQAGAAVIDEPAGVGRGNTPTPGGLYYTRELLTPTDGRGRYDPQGPYGPFAYSLSGFSDVLRSFSGGPGTIGIHGTNDPGGLGSDVSHGCIRVSNAAITEMRRMLPLGVPVEIVA